MYSYLSMALSQANEQTHTCIFGLLFIVSADSNDGKGCLLRLIWLVRECIALNIFSNDSFTRHLLSAYALERSPSPLVSFEQWPSRSKLLYHLPVYWDSIHERNQRRVALYGYSSAALEAQQEECMLALRLCIRMRNCLMAESRDVAGRELLGRSASRALEPELSALLEHIMDDDSGAEADLESRNSHFSIGGDASAVTSNGFTEANAVEGGTDNAGASVVSLHSTFPMADITPASFFSQLHSSLGKPLSGIAAMLCPEWLLETLSLFIETGGEITDRQLKLSLNYFSVLGAARETVLFLARLLSDASRLRAISDISIIIGSLRGHLSILGLVGLDLRKMLLWLENGNVNAHPLSVSFRRDLCSRYAGLVDGIPKLENLDFNKKDDKPEFLQKRRPTNVNFTEVLQHPESCNLDEFRKSVSTIETAARFISWACLSAAGLENYIWQIELKDLCASKIDSLQESDGEIATVITHLAHGTRNAQIGDKIFSFGSLCAPDDIKRAFRERQGAGSDVVVLSRIVESSALDSMTNAELDARVVHLSKLISIAIVAIPKGEAVIILRKCFQAAALRRISMAPSPKSLAHPQECFGRLLTLLVQQHVLLFADYAAVFAHVTKTIVEQESDISVNLPAVQFIIVSLERI